MASVEQARKNIGCPEKWKKRELDPGVDYLINADSHMGFKCRRKVFNVCFDNDMAAHDIILQDALDDWREKKTISTYGWAHLNDLGPSLVMPNSMLDRIIDCAHYYKLNSVHDVKKETGWMDADKFSAEIVALVQRHALPVASPCARTPLRPHLSSHVNVPLPLPSPCPAPRTNTTKRKIKCSACNQEGHNGTSFILFVGEL
ncbi:hypothetical protein DFJ58DRAFT_667460 [Suillus subalutaceus]|uniref:uncharacterized protein n=1 Tax=Suillus subalutaceus TaxID=48586 RepID=UPI001B878CA0|nr:uncharacterized protein DFJ58DRAFT_667460 [Suillus subalutaceus]KAG1839904.1 hypothetical protein DFJ58DRAFT_667460 [Suillus subalutaceus]